MHDYTKVHVTSQWCVRVSLGASMKDFTLYHILLVRFGTCAYSGYQAPFSTLFFKLTADWIWVFRPAAVVNH